MKRPRILVSRQGITFSLDKRILERLRALSKQHHMRPSHLIEYILDQAFMDPIILQRAIVAAQEQQAYRTGRTKKEITESYRPFSNIE